MTGAKNGCINTPVSTKHIMQTEIKARRGRPAGSNSFVKIRLSDLINMVGSQAAVPVSKVWLREMGFATDEEVSVVKVAAVQEQKQEEPKIEFKLETFSDED